MTLAQHWSNTKVSTVEVQLLAKRWQYNYASQVILFLNNLPTIVQHMLVDCYRVIFLNTVRFSLILHFGRWELFLGTWNAWVSRKIKSNQIKSNTLFLERHFWDQLLFTKPVSIKRTSHTNQRNTGTTCRVDKLFI